MTKSVVPRLEHILEAIDDLNAITEARSGDDLGADRHARLLIERNFEILSEASRYVPDDMKARHGDVPWPTVAGIGNVIRHDYDEVAVRLLLEVIRDHLPNFERVCRATARAP